MKSEIDIFIDEITNCLVRRSDGIEIDTFFQQRRVEFKDEELLGWNFDWNLELKEGNEVYELFSRDTNSVQGRISVRKEKGYYEVNLVEAATQNIGSQGVYIGVGGHLFALACLLSKASGFEGFVAFTSKTNVIEYYCKALHASVIQGQRLMIDSVAAEWLISKYFGGAK